jgi:hypothetical protein
MKARLLKAVLPALLLTAAPLAGAAEPPKLDPANTAWMITASVLVLFMTLPGLALFYAGLVRAKNVLSVLMQCFAITCVVTLAWVAVGYSIAFGDGGSANAWFGGFGKSLLAGIDVKTIKGSIPETVFAMFQLTFAIITPALVIGAYAERVRFGGMLLFSLLWLLLVYCPIAHWVWGDGWLQKMGVMDFAGGLVVHLNAGMAALVCALVLGKRRGFPDTAMPPHNMTMTVTGACMLWWLVRLQRGQRACRRRRGGHGDAGDAHRRGHGIACVADMRKAALRQTFGARHRHGHGGGLGHHHARLGLRRAAGRDCHRRRRGRDLLLRHELPQAPTGRGRFARRIPGARGRRHPRHAAHRRVRVGCAGRHRLSREGDDGQPARRAVDRCAGGRRVVRYRSPGRCSS